MSDEKRKQDIIINAAMCVVMTLQAAFFAYIMLYSDCPKTAAKATCDIKPIEIKKGSVEEAILKLYSVRTEMAIEEHTTDMLEKDAADAKMESINKLSEMGSVSARQVAEVRQEARRAELNLKYSKLAIEEAKHQYRIVEDAVLSGKFCPTVSADFDIRQRRPR